MSKVNKKTKGTGNYDKSTRLAGGSGMYAAKQSNIALLRRLTLANLLWENIAYVDGETVTNQIAELVPQCDPQAVADLVVECRTKQKLRHTPLQLLVFLAKNGNNALIEEITPQIVTRTDMITDLLALYEKENGGKLKPLSKGIKKGIAQSFHNFDEYQFAKYDRDNAIKLRDAIKLTHPKPKDQAQSELFNRIKERTLKTPETWEVGLSAAKTDEEKRQVWTSLIEKRKLGAMAFLRNLSNMKKVDLPRSVITKGFETLRSSMLLPLNFLQAVKHNPEFTSEIEKMMLKCFEHMPKLSGRTLFILDKSGSMFDSISSKSQFNRLDVAKAMGMLAINMAEDCEMVITAGYDPNPYSRKEKEKIGYHLSEHIKYPQKGFGFFDQVNKADVGGGGIFTRQVLEWSRENLTGEFDRIIVFSDSQDCDKVNKVPQPFGKYNYLIDVSSHKNGVNYQGSEWDAEISGWSENFLNFIAEYEKTVELN